MSRLANSHKYYMCEVLLMTIICYKGMTIKLIMKKIGYVLKCLERSLFFIQLAYFFGSVISIDMFNNVNRLLRRAQICRTKYGNRSDSL